MIVDGLGFAYPEWVSTSETKGFSAFTNDNEPKCTAIADAVGRLSGSWDQQTSRNAHSEPSRPCLTIGGVFGLGGRSPRSTTTANKTESSVLANGGSPEKI